MSTIGFSSTDQVINLLRNGAFEFLKPDDPADIPFWEVTGLATQIVESNDGPTKALQVTLTTEAAATLMQSFRIDTEANVFDFVNPLAPYSRASIEAGYNATALTVLPHKTPFTLSFAIKVLQGKAVITLIGKDYLESSSLVFTHTGEDMIALSSGKKWVRPSFRFSTNRSPVELGLNITRAPGAGLTIVQISQVALYNGYYDSTTYTGDPLSKCVPKDAIILCMGSHCPAGFTELGEDDLTPPASWVVDEPSAKARQGNYPRAAEGLTGAPTHASSTPGFTPKLGSIEEFVGFDSKIVLTNPSTGNPPQTAFNLASKNIDVDLPDASGLPTHSHVLRKAGSRPTAITFRFCKRL
jgi:hypothetical protein